MLQASISTSTIAKVTWDMAQKLTAEPIVWVTGLVVQQASGDDGVPSSNIVCATIFVPILNVAWASRNLPFSSCHRKKTLSHVGLEERFSNRILHVRYAASEAIFKLHLEIHQPDVEFFSSNSFRWRFSKGAKILQMLLGISRTWW